MRWDDEGVWLIGTRKDPNTFPEMTEMTLARMAGPSGRRGIEAPIREIHFTHKAPPHRAAYGELFNRPVIFESDRNGVLLSDASFMAQRFPHPCATPSACFANARRYCSGKCNPPPRHAARWRAFSFLCCTEASHRSTPSRASSQVSQKTLYRKLKLEGVTFNAVVAELRRQTAIEYVRAGKLPLSDIAYLVGFSEPSALARAFKSWTGVSLREFRARERS